MIKMTINPYDATPEQTEAMNKIAKVMQELFEYHSDEEVKEMMLAVIEVMIDIPNQDN